ncbi:MAG: HDIG domain-containing protein [Planctomycetes bacterium]|nr:HDIG domain-containing protein [Planctomycetota bacterium]
MEREEANPRTTNALLAVLFVLVCSALVVYRVGVPWAGAFDPVRLLGVLLVVLVLGLVLGLYVARFEKAILGSPAGLLRFLAPWLLTLAVAKALVAWEASPYWTPVSLVGIVYALAYSSGLAFASVGLLSLLVALIAAGPGATSPDLGLALTLGLGSATGVFSALRVRDRNKLLWAGLSVGLVQVVAALAMRLAAVDPDGLPWGLGTETDGLRGFLADPLYGLGNGIAVGFLAYHTLPLIEAVFGVTTGVSLALWADHNHPLLRRLMLEAPGTYHHSMMVGTLAEAGAEAIRADALLCRVGAYYHDIGKLAKPEYFYENTMGQVSLHDRLNPHMSAMIILAHPKDGAEIAREEGMPARIVDFIREHHGTTPVEYFFDKAVKQAEADEQGGGGRVLESAYRYPGPQPRSRETAILMLADTVEAVTRTLSEPTVNSIEKVVDDTLVRKMGDGQFGSAPITLGELARIRDAFVRRLLAIYHARIKYPRQVEEERVEGRPGAGGANGGGEGAVAEG